MKKIILTTIALSIILTINAQKIGTKLGLNLSGVNTSTQLSPEEIAKLLPGICGGFVFDYTPKHIGLVAEALYSQKGYKVKADAKLIDGTTDVTTDISLHLNYIEVPVMLKVKFGPAFIVAGPYMAYAMDGKRLVTMTVDGKKLLESQVEEQGQIPSNDVFKGAEFNGDNVTFSRTDYGINIGAGAEFLMFFAEARYGLGLANVSDFENMPSNFYTKNYTITLSVGVKFGK